MLYIHPDECVDCGACEPVCPVEAIFYEDDLPEKWRDYTAANVDFFDELGSPGGASKVGKTDQRPRVLRTLPPRARGPLSPPAQIVAHRRHDRGRSAGADFQPSARVQLLAVVGDRVDAEPVGVGDEPGRGLPVRAGHADRRGRRPRGVLTGRSAAQPARRPSAALRDLGRLVEAAGDAGRLAADQRVGERAAPRPRAGRRRCRRRRSAPPGPRRASGRVLPVRHLHQRVEELLGRLADVGQHAARRCPSPATGAAAARRPSRDRPAPGARLRQLALLQAGGEHEHRGPLGQLRRNLVTAPTIVAATDAWSVSSRRRRRAAVAEQTSLRGVHSARSAEDAADHDDGDDGQRASEQLA